jgi:hypothetical protein
VLILSPSRDPLRDVIPSNRIFVSIDAGPWFRATHARPEGDDLISISILLDLRGGASHLMDHVDDALGSLAPAGLHPTDVVSLYALDCEVIRTLNAAYANGALLRVGGAELVRGWRMRTASHKRCTEHVSLQDTLLYLVNEMNTRPGRRVLLVVSEGLDEPSKVAWRQIAETAQSGGTAIFGVSPQASQLPSFQQVRGVHLSMSDGAPAMDEVCQLSGGTLVGTASWRFARTLADVLSMVRGRYVVDFPRPVNSTPGRHTLEVRVEKSAAFVRPAGISLPIADPATLADPTTVPSDPTIAPVQGKRAALPR